MLYEGHDLCLFGRGQLLQRLGRILARLGGQHIGRTELPRHGELRLQRIDGDDALGAVHVVEVTSERIGERLDRTRIDALPEVREHHVEGDVLSLSVAAAHLAVPALLVSVAAGDDRVLARFTEATWNGLATGTVGLMARAVNCAAENTRRLIRAAQNKFVHLLGHLSGRLLLEREAYPVNQEAVIDACAETGTWLELNCNPRRFDLDWRLWPRARSKGVKCVLNPDAHRNEQAMYLRLGIGVARTLNFSVPTSISASRCFTRLWYQPGCVGAPPFGAAMT